MTLGARPSDGSSSSRMRGFDISAARDRQHLLLAARQQPGALVPGARAGAGSARTSSSRRASRPAAVQEGAQPDVVAHAQLREHLPAFGHQHQAQRARCLSGPRRGEVGTLAGGCRPAPAGAGPRAPASASTCPRRWRPAAPPPRPRAPAGRCRAARRRGAVRRRRACRRPASRADAAVTARRRGSAAPGGHRVAQVGLAHLRVRTGPRPACRGARCWPASSTTMRSETPITSAMSCSTTSTPTPVRGDAAQQRGQPCLVLARQAGGGFVQQQHLRAGGQRAGDLHQAACPRAARSGRRAARRPV